MSALISLVSKGVQDAYLTGDPQVSFFRQNYKRHTNFSLKPERIDYIGTFGSNNEVNIPIKSKGDLLTYVWVEATGITTTADLATGFNSNSNDPTEFILMIGGQQICKLDSLYIDAVHNLLYNETQAQASMASTGTSVGGNAIDSATGYGNHYIIPFFFSQDWTKALPLAALQYHEVEIRVKCRSGFLPASTPKVYAMYAYLDTDERNFLTEREHEILITQTQYQPVSNTDTEFDLTYFNHPCKAVHLVSGDLDPANGEWDSVFNFDESTLYINGTALFEGTSAEFHHTVVPRMHCQNLPSDTVAVVPTFTWPFSLNLSKSQPTGSLNFSRLDTAKINITNPTGGNNIHRVYGVNYNILRIKNGMAGVAFSN
jgi:hypothetical protein